MTKTATVICAASWPEQIRKRGRGLPAKRWCGRLAQDTTVVIAAVPRRGKPRTGRESKTKGSMARSKALVRKVRTALWITKAIEVQ